MKKYNHLTLEKRKTLKKYLNCGMTISSIAKELNVSLSTIYREIKRGTENNNYNPELSFKKYEESLKQKGKEPILSLNEDVALLISELILKKKMSPSNILDFLKEKGYDDINSVNTIYSAIDNGLIPNVKRENLRIKTTTIFSNGLIHIPKWVINELDIKDGDKVGIEIIDNKIIIEINN